MKEFFQPHTLTEALELRNREKCVILAGGTDFVIAMRRGMIPEADVIDLSKVSDLKGITPVGGCIRIGSMTTFDEIGKSPLLRENANVLCEAAKTVGSPQIRNRSTVGGNLCNASAAADSIAPLLCLDAEVELASMGNNHTISTRRLPLDQFLISAGKTALNQNEIMTAIWVQAPPAGAGSSFQKIGRRNALAIARVNGSCILHTDNALVREIRFALGASSSKPERIPAVESLLLGQVLTDALLEKAGKCVTESVLARTGTRASGSYKLPVIERFTVSLINAALERSH